MSTDSDYRDTGEASREGAAGHEDGVAYLDQALWSQLQNPVDLDAFGAAWLTLLSRNIRSVRAGVLVLTDGADRQMRPVAVWPRGWVPTPPVTAAAEAAIKERTGIARAAEIKGASADAVLDRCQIAYPIMIDGVAAGVVSLEMDIRPKREITLALRQMQWGAAWVERTIRKQSVTEAVKNAKRLSTALELFSVILDTRGVEEAANAFATEIVTALECDRAAIGAQMPRAMSVIALSHSAHFDKRMNLIANLTRVMEEAADQNTAICLPNDKDGILVVREHEAFSQRNVDEAVLSVPFRIDDQRAGVIVLERGGDKPFMEDEIELMLAVSALAGPLFEDRFEIEKPIRAKATDWAGAEIRKLTGPEDTFRKIALASLAAIFLFCVFATGTYRVAADTRIEGSVRRTVVAPIDGYVDASSTRPGDRIADGAILAQLDTTELSIERLHWLSEKRKVSLEYAKAISSRDRAALGVLDAQIKQADARLELIDLQIKRSALRSPFDGIVVAGDLTQRIGASVGRGDVLFEIAPLDDYRVTIQVDEKDIGFIEQGQTGRLILASMPTNPVPFVVRAITPVSNTEDGSNVFRVEADLASNAVRERLRPGMEGIAKIDIGKRRLIWIWTHEITNWVRMTLWRWTP